MKKSVLKVLSLLVVLSFFAGSSYAFGPKGGGFGFPPIGVLVKELKLTSEQKDQLIDLFNQTQKEMIKTRAEMRITMIDLRTEMMKDNPDEKVINNLIDKIGEYTKKLTGIRVSRHLEVKKILTPEQREKLRELILSRKWRRGPRGRRGFRRGMGQGRFGGGMGFGPNYSEELPEE